MKGKGAVSSKLQEESKNHIERNSDQVNKLSITSKGRVESFKDSTITRKIPTPLQRQEYYQVVMFNMFIESLGKTDNGGTHQEFLILESSNRDHGIFSFIHSSSDR